jgi:hypothetical protein
MARRLNLLSPKFVETIEKPGRYADGGGLYLQVGASRNGGVTKSWLFRYMRGHLSRTGNPTSREMGLGPLSTNKRDGFCWEPLAPLPRQTPRRSVHRPDDSANDPPFSPRSPTNSAYFGRRSFVQDSKPASSKTIALLSVV